MRYEYVEGPMGHECIRDNATGELTHVANVPDLLEAQSTERDEVIAEAVGLMRQSLGWVRGVHADGADDAVTHLYKLRDFIAKHGKEGA